MNVRSILITTLLILLVGFWYLVRDLGNPSAVVDSGGDPKSTRGHLREACGRLAELAVVDQKVFTNLFAATNSFIVSREKHEYIMAHLDSLAKSRTKFGVHFADQWGQDLNAKLLGVRFRSGGDDNVVLYDIQIWSNGLDGINNYGLGDDISTGRVPIKIVLP